MTTYAEKEKRYFFARFMIEKTRFSIYNHIEKNPPMWIAALAFLLIAGRFLYSLTYPDHLGVDAGAYLLQLNEISGKGSTNASFTRLPLGAGYTLLPFTSAFGVVVGYKLWSAIFAVLPLLPALFLLFSRVISKPWALAAAFISVSGWLTQEMYVTGALPLVGFGYTALIMWGTWGIAEESQRTRYAIAIGWQKIVAFRYEITIALALGLLAFTNHTVAGISAVILPIWTITLAIKHPYRIFDMAWPVGMGIGLAMFAYPYYPQVGVGSEIYRYEGPLLFIRPTIQDMGWYIAAAGFVTSYAAFKLKWYPYAAVLAFLSFWAPFYSFDETIVNLTYRGRFLAALLMPVVWVQIARERFDILPYRAQVINGVLIVALLVIGSLLVDEAQRRYSTFVTPQVERVLDVVKQHPEKGSILSSNFGEGTYYQALTEREVYYTFAHNPPRAFKQSEADVRCIFNWVENCNVDKAIERLDARFVVVNRKWPAHWGQIYGAPADGKDPVSLWTPLDDAAWLVPLAEEGLVKAWLIR
jgi:hypothetical protein|tara:strand:- start:5752 stop:7335 length:1584 start_codon:yes stop_codon:yes gene_type:complete